MTPRHEQSLVLEPTRIGGVEIRNRLFVPAHTTNFARTNEVTERYVTYLTERARGGAGLIFTEAVRVHPSSLRRFGLGGFASAQRHGFAELAESVQREGSRLFAQIMHTGRHDGSEWTGLWAPSAIPWGVGQDVPHAMTSSEISLLVEAFGSTAQMLMSAGIDGAEVHLGHGHLLQQFLSPATNHRTDAYGGSHANRLRLARQVLTAVFEQADIPIGLRISADEMIPDGLNPDYMLDICDELIREFPIAFLHVSHSAYIDDYSLATQMADMSFSSAPFREYPRLFKTRFPDTPILAVCRVDNTRIAEELLRAGYADLIGMARAHIADPSIARKTSENRSADVRSCIACNQACVGRLERTLPIRCVVNPEAGLEREWRNVPSPHAQRRVLVIGGGPAGLEAAATAAQRGHEVLLAERTSHFGGQVDLIRNLGGRERFGVLIDEQVRVAKKRGVKLSLSLDITVEDILNGNYDEIVLAAGSTALLNSPGINAPCTVFEAPGILQDNVVVVDEDGSWAAPSLAVHLAAGGHRVTISTPMDQIFPKITMYSRPSLYARLRSLDVAIYPLTELILDEQGTVTLRDVITGIDKTTDSRTSVVKVAPRAARDEILHRLQAAGFDRPIHLIGDAFAPRTVLEATFEGRGAGMLIGVDSVPEWHGPPLRMPYSGTRGGELLRPGLIGTTA